MGGKSKSLLLDALVVCSYFIRDNEDVVFISGYSPGSSSKRKKNMCAHKTGKSSIFNLCSEHINMHETSSNNCG